MIFRLVYAAAILLPGAASAFDRCDRFMSGTGSLAERLAATAVYDAPAADLDLAESVVWRDEAEPVRLTPYAAFENGQRVIVFPEGFEGFLCRVVIGDMLAADAADTTDVFYPAASALRDCLFDNRNPLACQSDFADALEVATRPYFDALDDHGQTLFYGLAEQAMLQVADHELAHHLLGHLPGPGEAPRVSLDGKPLARIDEEFEADAYAIFNALEVGRNYLAAASFFRVMSVVHFAALVETSLYEDFPCRTTNVMRTLAAVGPDAMAVLDAPRTARVDATELRSRLDEAIAFLSQPPGEDLRAQRADCSRLSDERLVRARADMLALARTLKRHEAAIVTGDRPNSPAFEVLLSDDPEMVIRDVADTVGGMQETRNIGAGILSHVAQRAGHNDGYTISDDLVEALRPLMLRTASARNYGRFLNAIAARDIARMHGSEAVRRRAEALFAESVRYNPEIVDSWLNLGLIAWKNRECSLALERFDRALAHAAAGLTRRYIGDRIAAYRAMAGIPGHCDER